MLRADICAAQRFGQSLILKTVVSLGSNYKHQLTPSESGVLILYELVSFTNKCVAATSGKTQIN